MELEHGGSDNTPDIVDTFEVLALKSIEPEAATAGVAVCNRCTVIQFPTFPWSDFTFFSDFEVSRTVPTF